MRVTLINAQQPKRYASLELNLPRHQHQLITLHCQKHLTTFSEPRSVHNQCACFFQCVPTFLVVSDASVAVTGSVAICRTEECSACFIISYNTLRKNIFVIFWWVMRNYSGHGINTIMPFTITIMIRTVHSTYYALLYTIQYTLSMQYTYIL